VRSCAVTGQETTATSGSIIVTPTLTTTYRVTCTSTTLPATTVAQEVTVTVSSLADDNPNPNNNQNQNSSGGTSVVADSTLSRPVTPPAYHSRGFTIAVGDTSQSLFSPITLPRPTVTSAPKAWVPKLQGTAGVDVFESVNFGGNPTFISNGGNDVVYLPGLTSFGLTSVDNGSSLLAVARHETGVLKLHSAFANVIYTGTPRNPIIHGNSKDNVLVSAPTGGGVNSLISLNGGQGDDIIVAGPLRDQIVIDKDGGTDTIIGFNTALSGGDVVRLYPGAYTSYRELASALRQVGSDTVLVMKNGEELWFKNTTVTTLGPAHFTKLSSDWSAGQVRGISTDMARFFSRLSLRSSGDEVRLLQETLRSLGYYHDDGTGYFGPLTEAAVTAFQIEHAVPPLGIVGPLTRALLNGALSAE
jgi:hypothetical protein